jgi:hypothetical protein
VEPTAAAAVESASSAAAETAATHVTVESATGESASHSSPSPVAITWPTISITRSPIAVTRSPVPKPRPAINRPPIEAAAIAIKSATIPGTRSDEDAAIEPRRAVIAIRRASIGGVPVVAVSTSWRIIAVIPVRWDADSNTNCNLSMRIGCRWDQKDTEQSEIP